MPERPPGSDDEPSAVAGGSAMADAPARLVVVTGTGTEVGKTWVAAGLLSILGESGIRCSARKPAQSFEPDDTAPRDSQVLAEATGEDPALVCPLHRNYPLAMAPPMAADALGLVPAAAGELLAEVGASWKPDTDLGLVELAGGVRSPMSPDSDCAGFARLLEPTHLLLVADAGLGTINAVMSSIDSLLAAGAVATTGAAPTLLVHLNRYEDSSDLHLRNREWLASRLEGTFGELGGGITTAVGGLADLLT